MTNPLAAIPIETENEVIDQLNTRFEIIHHMARAFFASAWLDWADNYGPKSKWIGVDVDDMPNEIDPAALKAAHELATLIEDSNGKNLVDLLNEALLESRPAYRPNNPKNLGHCLAMQAMGLGEGLSEMGLEHHWIIVPHLKELTCYDLDPARYPR